MDVDPYRNKTRIRVNGLLVRDDALLLVKMFSPVSKEQIWIPPGGGLEYGERMSECLKREFREETGITVNPGDLYLVNELLETPYHAIEFYFWVDYAGGSLVAGNDPEHGENDQILEEVKFIPFSDLPAINLAPGYLAHHLVEDYRSGDSGIHFSAKE